MTCLQNHMHLLYPYHHVPHWQKCQDLLVEDVFPGYLSPKVKYRWCMERVVPMTSSTNKR